MLVNKTLVVNMYNALSSDVYKVGITQDYNVIQNSWLHLLRWSGSLVQLLYSRVLSRRVYYISHDYTDIVLVSKLFIFVLIKNVGIYSIVNSFHQENIYYSCVTT